MKKAIIKIELRSDLCPGSGYGYAGIIDSDISYDEVGLPYIPARRLKGCLLEAGRDIYLKEDVLNKIFGISGSDRSGSLRIDNARIENYQQIKKECQEIINRSDINSNEILNIFTSTRAQTRVEDGVAKENSLRFSRVINKYSPLKEKDNIPLIFEAKISLNDDELYESFEECVLALRNMGMKRSRGLGSVSCKLIEDNNKEENDDYPKFKDNVLAFELVNEDALVLSSISNNDSERYINASSIIGALANTYLQENEADELFYKLFLSGEVQFKNAYLSKNGKRYIPAPIYINKLKKSGKKVNVLKYDKENNYDKDYKWSGNPPKLIKDKFVSYENNQLEEGEVEVDINYHHANSKNKKDKVFYNNEVIRSNQSFAAYVVSDKYHDEIEKLFRKTNFRFGRSKSAQYGSCTVKDTSIKTRENNKYQGKVVVTLLSDAIFTNDKGIYTTNYQEVRNEISKKLFAGKVDTNNELDKASTKEIVGYYGKWNLRKQAIPGIAAGSAFVFDLKEEVEIDSFACVGHKNNEGFGEIRIDKFDDMSYVIEEKENKDKNNKNNIEIIEFKTALKRIYSQKLLDELICNYIEKHKKELSNPAVSKLSLIVAESINSIKDENPKLLINSKDFYNAFYKKAKDTIDNIKSKSTRDECSRFLKSKDNDEILSNIDDEKYDFGFSKKDIFAEIKLEYLRQTLVCQKYFNKENS